MLASQLMMAALAMATIGDGMAASSPVGADGHCGVSCVPDGSVCYTGSDEHYHGHAGRVCEVDMAASADSLVSLGAQGRAYDNMHGVELWKPKERYPVNSTITSSVLFVADTNNHRVVGLTLDAAGAGRDFAFPLPDEPHHIVSDRSMQHMIVTSYRNLYKVNVVTGAVTQLDLDFPDGYRHHGVCRHKKHVFIASTRFVFKYNEKTGSLTTIASTPSGKNWMDCVFHEESKTLVLLDRRSSDLYTLKWQGNTAEPKRFGGVPDVCGAHAIGWRGDKQNDIVVACDFTGDASLHVVRFGSGAIVKTLSLPRPCLPKTASNAATDPLLL